MESFGYESGQSIKDLHSGQLSLRSGVALKIAPYYKL